MNNTRATPDLPTSDASAINARLDRLPPSRHVWKLVSLLSLGGFFEIYDLGLTAILPPGLIQAGVFHDDARGLFGLTDQAAFAAATFAGLFLGTVSLGAVADRFGRRAIFTASLLWYAASTLVMALQSSAVAIDLWRFIAGIGIGLELVTIDTFIAELVPKGIRGKAFAINQSLQLTAVPVAALLGWLLTPLAPLDVAGWRWVAIIPAFGALAVWWIRRSLPESPRWLAQRGRLAEAERVTAAIEARIVAEIGHALPEPTAQPPETIVTAGFVEILRPPYAKRTSVLVVLNVFQAIGFYGFGNWLPALLASQGTSFVKSLQYSFVIAIVYPLAPLVFSTIADRIERKWQIAAAALGVAVFGLIFAQQTSAAMLILCGALITASNNLLSYAYHAYQAELFPTRVRARAVGFVYSFSRLSTVAASFAIALLLKSFGAIGVFAFIACSMAIVALAVGIFGPRTRGASLEELSR